MHVAVAAITARTIIVALAVMMRAVLVWVFWPPE
jgi:hypothetical protein